MQCCTQKPFLYDLFSHLHEYPNITVVTHPQQTQRACVGKRRWKAWNKYIFVSIKVKNIPNISLRYSHSFGQIIYISVSIRLSHNSVQHPCPRSFAHNNWDPPNITLWYNKNIFLTEPTFYVFFVQYPRCRPCCLRETASHDNMIGVRHAYGHLKV